LVRLAQMVRLITVTVLKVVILFLARLLQLVVDVV
jgi:hypothetical protein